MKIRNVINTMPQDIRELMEETIDKVAKITIHELKVEKLLRVMCEGVYLAGMNTATKIIEEVSEKGVSPKAFRETLIEMGITPDEDKKGGETQ